MNAPATFAHTDTPEAAITMLQVTSTPPIKVADADMVVCWARRSTTANPVSTTQRYRGTMIPRAKLAIPSDKCSSQFYMLLQSTIHGLADACFTAYIRERMDDVTIPAAVLTLDNVLAFWAEEKQRQVVDAEKITAWLPKSETWKALTDVQRKAWASKLPKIAAPSYALAFTKENAAAIITKIATEDMEHPIALFIATRCTNVINKETEENAF